MDRGVGRQHVHDLVPRQLECKVRYSFRPNDANATGGAVLVEPRQRRRRGLDRATVSPDCGRWRHQCFLRPVRAPLGVGRAYPEVVVQGSGQPTHHGLGTGHRYGHSGDREVYPGRDVEVAIAELVRGGATGISPVQRHGVVIVQRTRQAGGSTGPSGLRRNRRDLPGQEHQKHRYGNRATQEIPRPPVRATCYASPRLFPHARVAAHEAGTSHQRRCLPKRQNPASGAATSAARSEPAALSGALTLVAVAVATSVAVVGVVATGVATAT